MNYEEMSDFEINKAVSSKFRKVWTWKGKVYLSMTSTKPFDPCNNPNDAFPIIVDNGISLVWMDAKVSYYEAHGINEEIWDEDWHSQHPNALRAAMICFLKMKDAEK